MAFVTHSLQRLEALNEKCGGTTQGKPVRVANEEDVDTSNMTAYEKAQYSVACRVKKTRENMATLEEVQNTANVTRRIELSNNIRKDLAAMKRETTQLQSIAVRDGKREEYDQLMEHVKRTEQQFRARQGGGLSGGGGEADGLSSGATGSSGATAFQDEEMRSLGEPMMSLREDEEFAMFFEQTKQHDQEIDNALDRIGLGLTRLQDNAVTIQSELKTQEKLLDETEEKVETVTSNLKAVNKRLKKTLKAMDKDRMCIYVFMCIILLAIIGVIYFIAS